MQRKKAPHLPAASTMFMGSHVCICQLAPPPPVERLRLIDSAG